MARATITDGFERGRGAIISTALAFPQRRIAIYDPPGGGPFIPPLIEPVFPDPPGGGHWDPDGGTVGTDPITFPGDPGSDAPFLVVDGGPVTLTGAQFTGGPTTCVGWRYELSIDKDRCVVPSAAELAVATITINIETVDAGDVTIQNIIRYLGDSFCNDANAGANLTLQSESITGGSHAGDWTVATNCKGNGTGVLSGVTVPTGQVYACCGGFNRAVWWYGFSCAFCTTGGNARAVAASFDFSSPYGWAFGHFTLDLT